MKRQKVMVLELLKSIETKDQQPAEYINADSYTQHNLMCRDGVEGFAEVMTELAKYPNPASVNTVRIFEDGDFVFAHSLYNFFGEKVGFDIFRFEDGLIVEHWDNMCEAVAEPNGAGHSMTDGAIDAVDIADGEHYKPLIVRYISDIMIDRKLDDLASFFDGDNYIEHCQCARKDGVAALKNRLIDSGESMGYMVLHKVLGEGNFVLAVSEGYVDGDHPASFYDLFRLDNDKIVEHWVVMEHIPEMSQWKNENGKFNFE